MASSVSDRVIVEWVDTSNEAIGYGLTHVMSAADSWVADTWVTGSRVGEIESLSVSAEYRGSGLGSMILDRLESHLRSRGGNDVILGALPGNSEAIRLYERRVV